MTQREAEARKRAREEDFFIIIMGRMKCILKHNLMNTNFMNYYEWAIFKGLYVFPFTLKLSLPSRFSIDYQFVVNCKQC